MQLGITYNFCEIFFEAFFWAKHCLAFLIGLGRATFFLARVGLAIFGPGRAGLFWPRAAQNLAWVRSGHSKSMARGPNFGSGFGPTQPLANIEKFRWNFSSSTNPEIGRSDRYTFLKNCIPILANQYHTGGLYYMGNFNFQCHKPFYFYLYDLVNWYNTNQKAVLYKLTSC